MNSEDLVLLNEQIAGMARAGLPLDQGLAALAKEMGRGRLQSVTQELAKDLESGLPLEEAIRKQSGRMPPYYAGLVAVGVRTGKIGEVLGTLTTYARSMANLRSTVFEALMYPGMIILCAGGLLVFLCAFVVPRVAGFFDATFRDFNMKLPWATTAAIWLAHQPWHYLAIPFVVALIVIIVARIMLGFSEAGRRRWTALVYGVPLAGTMIRTSRMAAFTNLLGILVDHGVPLADAVRWAGSASEDPILRVACERLSDELQAGLPFAECARGQGLVPEWVAWMVGMGEKHGSLESSLRLVADMYQRQAEMRAVILRNLLPPIMILATGALIAGFFIVALFLPMIKLLEGLSK